MFVPHSVFEPWMEIYFNDDARQRLARGPIHSFWNKNSMDGSGSIYMLRKDKSSWSRPPSHVNINHVKIGTTMRPVNVRVGDMSKNNKEKYEILQEQPTNFR